LCLCKLPFLLAHEFGNWKDQQWQVIPRDTFDLRINKIMRPIILLFFTSLNLDKVRVPKLVTASSRYTVPKVSSPAYCSRSQPYLGLTWISLKVVLSDPGKTSCTSLVVLLTSSIKSAIVLTSQNCLIIIPLKNLLTKLIFYFLM
jgi:hypothetical protein